MVLTDSKCKKTFCRTGSACITLRFARLCDAQTHKRQAICVPQISAVGSKWHVGEQHVTLQVLQKIRGTMEVEEEFHDICEACIEANKVWLP